MFSYNTLFLPPAPALELAVRNPQTGTIDTVLAKLDTAADSSIIPEDLAQTLGLTPYDRLLTIAFDGTREIKVSYLVDILLRGRIFTEIEVVTAPISYLLVGRDILNQCVTLLNGPQFIFDIK